MSFIISELKKIRKEQKLTQEELAHDIDTVKNQIHNWEAGLHSPTFVNVEKWARALGYELDLIKIERRKVDA